MNDRFYINTELSEISLRLSRANTALRYLIDDYFGHSKEYYDKTGSDLLLYGFESASVLVDIISDYTEKAAEMV